MSYILKKIKFWFENSRPYTIPITFLSWLVIFVYSVKQGGNFIYGLIAYVGVAIVHLATNLSDDYFDCIRLSKDDKFLKSAKECKLKYIKNGSATIKELGVVILIMLLFAALCGAFLYFVSGFYVLIFALIGFLIAIFYSFFSSFGWGDIAVILAYGPLMFEGVYYVMTKNLSLNVLILSLACAMFVNSILYAHMLMDYDEDVISGKTTLCTKLGSKDNALKGLMIFYILGYIFISLLVFITGSIYYLLPLLTLPLVYFLYKSLKMYNKDKTLLPQVKFYYYPLDNWNNICKTPNAPFFLRFLFARNISTWFMILTCFAIIFS